MCVSACVQIGGRTYTLQEVMARPDLVATMTTSEKAAYTELYREAYEELHTWTLEDSLLHLNWFRYMHFVIL